MAGANPAHASWSALTGPDSGREAKPGAVPLSAHDTNRKGMDGDRPAGNGIVTAAVFRRKPEPWDLTEVALVPRAGPSGGPMRPRRIPP